MLDGALAAYAACRSLYSDCRASHRARAASLGSSSAAGGPSAPDAGGPDAAASGVALVLLDELGKGTEVTAATAIVSTIVRRLVHLGSMGEWMHACMRTCMGDLASGCRH